MKKNIPTLVLMLFSAFCSLFQAQDLPQIIPPSPEASAFHIYGNTTANNYTGSPNVSIPIYTIQEGGLSLPIVLSYTAGNGVKVQDIATWVGMGWTLNTGGNISRVIRGIADDDVGRGILYTTIPSYQDIVNNPSILNTIRDGSRDTQSDKYIFNYPGGSGSFFYYNNGFHIKPKKNLKITHNIGIDEESIQPQNLRTNNSVIKDFTITDEHGNTYFFKDKERSNTKVKGGVYTTDLSFPSSWYINKIENRNKTKKINFTYEPFHYLLDRKQAVFSANYSNEDEITNETSYIGKRIKEINFSQGKIEFIASTNIRKDLEGSNVNNKYLDKIIVRNTSGMIIKTFQFLYQYMTPSGMIDDHPNLGISNNNRLFLKSIQEFDRNNNSKPAHEFTYNTSHILPNRNSKAIDHWGYYNGETDNMSFYPEQYITYYNAFNGDGWKSLYQFGSNRNPNENYAKSGILKKIKYPTGGETILEYESHTANTNEVSGIMQGDTIRLTTINQKIQFQVSLHSKPNPLTRIKLHGIFVNPTSCDMRIHIQKLGKPEESFLIPNNPGPGNDPTYLDLEDTSSDSNSYYEAWFTLENGSCTTSTAIVNLVWKNENPSAEKQIGGLRIKKISHKESTSSNFVNEKFFNYKDNNNISSGRIVNPPMYYSLAYAKHSSGTIYPLSYVKHINSVIPLATTQGSHVGYGKVTITDNNNDLGKQEYFYTTSELYPDVYNVVNPETDEYMNLYSFAGQTFKPFPMPEMESRDYMRGLLKKNVLLKKNTSSFDTVFRKDLSYKTFNKPLAGTRDPLVLQNTLISYNLKVQNNLGNYSTYYEIHDGYIIPEQVIEKTYNENGVSTKTTTNYYLENNIYAEYYTPIAIETTNSTGEILKTETDFVFSNPSHHTDLMNQNALYLPIATKTFNGSTKLSEQRTTYFKPTGNLVLPYSIMTSKGSQPLEDRIIYHKYDDYGNPLEISKKDGAHIVYIWGYHQTQPIAKIENANLSDISSSIYNDVIDKSNLDNDQGTTISENNLRTALTSLRNSLPNAQVTTFTYDPLIGVTSITDPRGRTVYYEYDSFNRLKHVKDHEGNILSKNEYNYKN